ncbi:MAG: hypothetical protein ABI382_12950 [Nakamurella sp.]
MSDTSVAAELSLLDAEDDDEPADDEPDEGEPADDEPADDEPDGELELLTASVPLIPHAAKNAAVLARPAPRSTFLLDSAARLSKTGGMMGLRSFTCGLRNIQ